MVNVILDSNVLISALVFGKKVGIILDKLYEGEYNLFYCSQIRTEVMTKLIQKFGAKPEQLEVFLKLLEVGKEYEVPDIALQTIQIRDPNDRFLLALAEYSQADFLVTGDKDVLHSKLSEHCSTIICTPNDFISYLVA